MELESVFALYSDTPPDNYETVYEDEWDKEWGSGYLREIVADFGGRKMVICIDDYTYTTHEYVRQWKETADNYRSIGCICPDLVKNKYGELSYGIRFCGRDCVVFAEEYPALPIAAESDLSIRTVSGRYLFHDDMLRMTAKIAALHIDTLPLSSATALFDPVTSGYYKDYEDWITEGFADFKEWALTHYPDQTQKIGTIEELFTENRSKLAEIYGKLPVSVFHGSETPPCILIDPDGNFAGFKEFRGGGRDTCVNHFVHLLNFLTEHLPDTYELDEISDPKLRKKRFDGIKRDLALIREHYTFTEDEIAVFPLLMRDRIINTYWFKDIIDKWASADENRIVQLFDYIIERFTSDPIDYKSILR